MAKPGVTPRHAAWRALSGVFDTGDMLTFDADLSGADAARAGRLARTTLRHLGRIDSLLGRFIQRKPIPLVHHLLRLGAAELLAEQAPAHGVVDAYVSLSKSSHDTRRAAGMINAVLRKLATQGPDIWANQGPQRLPKWLRNPLRDAYGADAVRAIEAAHEAGAPIDLTLKDDLAIDGAQILPTGSIRLARGAQVSALPGYETGAFWVQDAAAALPVRLLGKLSQANVLDLCAAPGGKTMQLAAAGARVTALDRSPERLERLRDNLDRTQLSAEIVIADACDWRGGPFDAILLDAPCSATGTIRRHPELPFIRSAADVAALTELQSSMIDAALAQLKPGGRLVYCTCSLLPEEGEAQITAALTRHPGLKALPLNPMALGAEPGWASPEGGLRLRPDYWAETGGMDGFFMAALEHR
ncbi:MAG: transcription antitermination factor NusB [Pseudomonadota bacterium]